MTTSTVENIDYDIISTKDIVLVVYTSDGIAITSQTGTIRIVDVNEPCNFTEDYYRIIREEGSVSISHVYVIKCRIDFEIEE